MKITYSHFIEHGCKIDCTKTSTWRLVFLMANSHLCQMCVLVLYLYTHQTILVLDPLAYRSAYEVWGKVMFSQASVTSVHTSGFCLWREGGRGLCMEGTDPPPSRRDTANRRSVHILLECILLHFCVCI